MLTIKPDKIVKIDDITFRLYGFEINNPDDNITSLAYLYFQNDDICTINISYNNKSINIYPRIIGTTQVLVTKSNDEYLIFNEDKNQVISNINEYRIVREKGDEFYKTTNNSSIILNCSNLKIEKFCDMLFEDISSIGDLWNRIIASTEFRSLIKRENIFEGL